MTSKVNRKTEISCVPAYPTGYHRTGVNPTFFSKKIPGKNSGDTVPFNRSKRRSKDTLPRVKGGRTKLTN